MICFVEGNEYRENMCLRVQDMLAEDRLNQLQIVLKNRSAFSRMILELYSLPRAMPGTLKKGIPFI